MRKIEISKVCFDFIENLDSNSSYKVYKITQVISEIKIVNSKFVKKLEKTKFYELRIKTNHEIRIIIFPIENSNFNNAIKIIFLYGFLKKSTKDYRKAILIAEKELVKYFKNT